MSLLEREIVVQSRSFDELRKLALQSTDRISHIPAIQPISGNNLRSMASGYGRRVDPVYGTVKMHEGMDFACDIGTPVYATGDGTIASAKWHSGYGNVIEINHGYGYTTRYAHLSGFNISAGDKVKRGDLIGYAGNTGKSTGPHVHYEVRLRGVPQNPVNYYFYDLSPEEYDEMIMKSENMGNVMD
jgi:murein DD-endopeptidase MepM/ murein hydrolase activator NlpD